MKFLTMLIIVMGMIVLFNMAGFETNSKTIVQTLIDGGLSQIVTSELWTKILAALTLAAGVGVVASLFGRTPDPTYVLAIPATILGGFIMSDLLSIWVLASDLTSGWIKMVLFLLLMLLIFGFMVSFISWWRGADG